jgi:hypothetical protein
MSTYLNEILLRWIIGGAMVSVFALLGNLLKPKSFAGLFGGAPSVALATLILTLAAKGKLYSATEAKSMAAGAVAFVVYAACARWLIVRYGLSSLVASSLLILLWFLTAFSLWALVVR